MANNILMVGHSGFIGQAILSIPTNIQFTLAKNRINLRKRESNDLIIKEAIAKNSVGILNLAWQSNNHDNYHKLKTQSDWHESTEYLTKSAVKAGLKVYLIGTGEDDYPPISNEYAIAKSQLKESLRDLITSGSVVWLRPFYVVSISEMRPRLIRGILESQSSYFAIESPQSTNDFILVEDVALAILRCLENETTGEIDIGSGVLTSNIQVAKIICETQNIPLPQNGNQPKRLGKVANIKYLEKLNWKPAPTYKFLSGKNNE